MIDRFTKPRAVSASREQLDNLLCYATVSPTGDYGYDRTKYDSFQEHNIGSVLEGIPEGIIAHNEVGNGIFTRVYKAEQALSKSEIDGIIQEIIELSKPYPPMNDIKLANIKNIITRIDQKKVNTIPWTVREEEIRKADNQKILAQSEIDGLILHMIKRSE